MCCVSTRFRLFGCLVGVLAVGTSAEAVTSKFTLKVVKFTRNNVTTTLNPPVAKFEARPGDRIEAEIHVSGWGPDLAPSGLLRTFQAQILGNTGVQSGQEGLILPVGWLAPFDPPVPIPCTLDSDCPEDFHHCDVVRGCRGRHACTTNADCTHPEYPVCFPVPGCAAAAHNPDSGAFINLNHPQWVHAGFGVVRAVDTSTLDYRWASTVQDSDGVIDGGVPKYCGTLLLQVSNDACGEFGFAFRSAGSFIADPSISPVTAIPALESLRINIPCPLAPVGCDPTNCAVDARIPHDRLNATPRIGWGPAADPIDVLFGGPTAGLTPSSFQVTQSGAGVPPTIVSATPVGNLVTIVLNRVITFRQHTCIRHIASDRRVCLGNMPGDTNGDGTSEGADVLALADELRGTFDPPMEIWQCDIDRNGMCEPLDFVSEVDVLNGESVFDVFKNPPFLVACPSNLP